MAPDDLHGRGGQVLVLVGRQQPAGEVFGIPLLFGLPVCPVVRAVQHPHMFPVIGLAPECYGEIGEEHGAIEELIRRTADFSM